jgi:transmembrane sensor
MRENIPDFILAYLHGDADKEQKQSVNEWFNDPENAELVKQIRQIDSLTDDLGMLRKFDLQKGRQQVFRKYRANQMFLFVKWMQRAAAILFIPVLIGGIWYYQKFHEFKSDLDVLTVNQEIITQPGTKSHFFLPDSTEVWLNSSSALKFPSIFQRNERRVNLSGEAIFKVFKNKKKPFIVGTESMDIEAVGTEFNVSAYSGDLKFSTTLAEGKVKITDKTDQRKVMYLNPGAQLNFDTQKKTYNAENVRVEDVIAWRNGILIFNETPFFEVVAKLGRWFNADIQINDPSIANYRFTGTFTSESLNQVLELLTLATPIAYSNSKREVLDDKTYSKQEIRIWHKQDEKITPKDKKLPMK